MQGKNHHTREGDHHTREGTTTLGKDRQLTSGTLGSRRVTRVNLGMSRVIQGKGTVQGMPSQARRASNGGPSNDRIGKVGKALAKLMSRKR